MGIVIIGIDQSLCATGIVTIYASSLAVLLERARCVTTKPDAKSRHLYQADADGLRVDEIARALIEELALASASAEAMGLPLSVACEAPAGAKSAKAAKSLGLAYGVIRGVCTAHGRLPVVVQAHHAKKRMAGDAGASKADMVRAAKALLGNWGSQTKSGDEAIADACAVALCALDEPTLAALWSSR